ncbi:DUF5682 family protein [Tropicibacter naphthalenivorans]|uniref:Uncharacterized protein n=1 Tax=Tropicibacter naphthalenivorans TaxID=441103 RepID=A0A0P1G1B3_9RHOB|nr:DUF5682 family protein [Tropicibacter naphthalenivorans]CUH75560.1 hypothetical protein TRN7648_00501 [Tropicibacter naphthalenivorans]SMC43661.1 hypothetical protein SAMN04488093_101378 [Tropicibacter naphthalenivorans]
MTADGFDPPLFQPDRGLWIAPIRHHSPACAWAVRALIREVRPKTVLIEGPADLSPLIPDLCDAATRPPVAAVMLREGRAAYLPLCDHSPEYVAMSEALAMGAEVRFIDLPSDRLFTGEQVGPIPATDEHAFDSGDYIAGLCARTGCRDGFELWDHLFESRLGEGDWRALLTDVGRYCAGLRAATPAPDANNAAREADMSAHIAQALPKGRTVAVVGGFHAPALTDPQGPAPEVPPCQDAYLIGYGHAAMDALAGYGAGLPQPGYYDALWHAAEAANGPPDWPSLTADLIQTFLTEAATQGHPTALPSKVELLRVAHGLAGLRGRAAVLRHDLFDAAQTALTKGQVTAHDAWAQRLRRHWHGTALGRVKPGQQVLPLVADARARAAKTRLDLTQSLEKQKRLDIHRKDAHLQTSRFLHAMQLLDSGFARMTAGPDYATGLGADRLFEEWSYGWSPIVETRLIQLATQGAGDSVAAACLWTLTQAPKDTLPDQITLLGQGIRAGLGMRLHPFVTALGHSIESSCAFAEMAHALQRLYGLSHTRGPMRAPKGLDLPQLLARGYARLVYLADDLPTLPEGDVPGAVRALRLVADLLASDTEGSLDPALFLDAVARLARRDAPPQIKGAALALALRSGHVAPADLVAALRSEFHAAVFDVAERTGVMRGMLVTAPSVLWTQPEVLAEIDGFFASLPEAEFLSLLPQMRRILTALNPRETDRLADVLAQRHGARPDIHSAPLSEAEVTLALEAHLAVQAALRADGLEDQP